MPLSWEAAPRIELGYRALQVLEVHAFLCGGEQVVYAGELELAQRFTVRRPPSV
jgi:hypothetical protein